MLPEERHAFEKELEGNTALQQMVEGYRHLKQQEKDPSVWLDQQRGKLDKVPTSKPIAWKKYAIAAIFTGIVFAGVYQQFVQKPTAHYDFKDSGLPVLMSDKKDDLNAIMIAYKASNIEEAQKLLESYVVSYGNTDTAQYYTGVFLKETGKYDEALSFFVPEAIEQLTLKQKAEMQRAICLEYLGRNSEANEIYAAILKNKDHLFYKVVKDSLN